MRKWRLKAGLLQKDAAAILDVDPLTVVNWELGKTGVDVRFYPAIIALLGFNPLAEGKTPGERIRRERMSRGWSRRRLAALAGIDEATVAKLEADFVSRFRGPRRAVLRTLNLRE
ncbi:MAG: helix-turn-helix domain-containing protein [Gemmatimonadaceae bacterium]